MISSSSAQKSHPPSPLQCIVSRTAKPCNAQSVALEPEPLACCRRPPTSPLNLHIPNLLSATTHSPTGPVNLLSLLHRRRCGQPRHPQLWRGPNEALSEMLQPAASPPTQAPRDTMFLCTTMINWHYHFFPVACELANLYKNRTSSRCVVLVNVVYYNTDLTLSKV